MEYRIKCKYCGSWNKDDVVCCTQCGAGLQFDKLNDILPISPQSKTQILENIRDIQFIEKTDNIAGGFTIYKVHVGHDDTILFMGKYVNHGRAFNYTTKCYDSLDELAKELNNEALTLPFRIEDLGFISETILMEIPVEQHNLHWSVYTVKSNMGCFYRAKYNGFVTYCYKTLKPLQAKIISSFGSSDGRINSRYNSEDDYYFADVYYGDSDQKYLVNCYWNAQHNFRKQYDLVEYGEWYYLEKTKEEKETVAKQEFMKKHPIIAKILEV